MGFPLFRMFRAFSLLLVTSLLAPAAVTAQTRAAGAGVIDGVVSTQGGAIRLGGVQVAVRDATDREIATVLSDGDGHFRLVALPDGRYRLVAGLAGFETTTLLAVVTAGKTSDVSLDLPIAAISQTVEVVGSAVVSSAGTLAPSDAISGTELDQYAPGGGLQAALRLLASIVEVPGGVSIKGGRPSQSSVQLGPGTLVDPSTGLTQVSLPEGAIDSVAVLPNPYAVEYGRFSSGLVVIQTRRAGDQWKTRLNNLDPTFRTRRGTMFDITGIGGFGPRLETGGPIVKDRLFIEQTAQFRYGTSDVASRPEDELRTTKWFSSFTRADANLSPRHSLVVTGGLFPNVTTLATLGTFIPPDATADIHSHVNHAGVTERALWTDSVFSETTVQVPRIPDRRGPAGCRRDGAAAGDDARQFLQHAAPQHVDVSGGRSGVRIAQRAGRTAPVQSRPRPAAQPVQRHEREQAGVDRARRRQPRPAARLRVRDGAVGRKHRCGAVRAGSVSAEYAVVPRVRRPHRSRRHRRSIQRDPAGRHCGAAEPPGQRGAARRVRSLL
ncbi:MAG: TonB-dependent receptor [Methanobacteriota archaeon]|nr:MAG: TonB-dependent receptor [Euryarchaeota archaeon]